VTASEIYKRTDKPGQIIFTRQKPQWETPEIHRMLMEPVPSAWKLSSVCIQFEIGREKVYPHA
jgi:hypothetical protein